MDVQIGAIPLHPGSGRRHKLFKRQMARLLDSSPEALNEKMIEYEKREHGQMIAETVSQTLLARIPDDLWYLQKKQFVWDNQLYYMPAGRNEPEISQLALYDSRVKGIVAWAEVRLVHKFSTEQLKNLGVSWPLRNARRPFRVFICSNWNSCFLSLPDLPDKAIYLSNWSLKQAVRLDQSVWLWLPDYSWIRAWQEISRIDENAKLRNEHYPDVEIHFSWKEEKWICHREEDELYLEKEGKKLPFTPDFDVFFG